MATGGDPVYTSGTALGARLQALLIDEGTPLARATFDWEVLRMNPPNLQEQLTRNKKDFTDPSKKLLNFDQQKVVYPSETAVDNSENFDIALLSLLLGILCHMKPPKTGWSKDPPSEDNSPVAWIIRLRLFRNKNYGHMTSTALSQEKFDQLWEELSVILIGLGADGKRISDRKSQDIDPDQARKNRETFERIYRDENEVKDLVVAQVSSLQRVVRKQTSKIKKLTQIARNIPGAHQRRSTQRRSFLPFMCHRNAEGMPYIIQKLRRYLRHQYRSKLRRIHPLPGCEDLYLDLQDMFTTLEMVCRDGLKKDTAVATEDMFQSYNDDVPQTIRVEGDPGIGKTTLCYKIVYDCSAKKSKFNTSNKFSSFKLVLYVEIRKVPKDTTDIDVKSTIFKQVFPEAYYKHEEEFWEYVECNPEDVLFVLDGLDEMLEETRDRLKVADFIRGKIIGNIHVIVTSRPYLCNKQLTSCERHFVIKGYSHENIEGYVDRHENLDSNSKEGMLKQLNENDNLHELTKNPLNLALLCMLWKEEWNDAALPQTITGLYSFLVLALVERFAEKYDFNGACFDINQSVNSIDCLRKMPEPIPQKINDLNDLAWKGTKYNQWYFSRMIVKDKGLEKLGFLRNDLLSRTNLNPITALLNHYQFEFLHRTFQEYFAAMYMYNLQSVCDTTVTTKHNPSTDHHDMRSRADLMKYIQNDQYHQVIKFLAGLLGTNAQCLFEAFHDCLKPILEKDNRIHNSNCLSTDEDERIVSLCLECLHECGAGTELVRYVADVLPRDWRVGSDTAEQVVGTYDVFSHIQNVRRKHPPYIAEDDTLSPYSFEIGCFGMCILSSKSAQMTMTYNTHFIRSNEALYGLVPLLQYRAKITSGPDLGNVHIRPGKVGSATCSFLKAILNTKVISFLAINIAHHENKLIEGTCNLFQCDAYRDLSCKLSMYPCKSSSLHQLSEVLSTVQTQTDLQVSLYSCVELDGSFDSTNQCKLSRVINSTVELGSTTRDKEASVKLYIQCEDDTYIPDFAASSMANVAINIKDYTLSISPQGSLELLFIVRNLPLMEKQSLTESTLPVISLIIQDSCCILSKMTFECSCEDGSVVSTIPLLQSLSLNQSLTEVSFLCDEPENVARCLHYIFAKNRTLKKLEIGFLHPVDDETMANIFSSYPVDSQSQIKSFSVVMETGTPNVSDCQSYEQTIRAILYICKNLCDGSALQNISFISGHGNIMMTTGATSNRVHKVKPVCPGYLLKPLAEAIVNSQLTVNLSGMIWNDVEDMQTTLLDQGVEKYLNSPNFTKSKLGRADTGVYIVQLFGQYMHSPLQLYLNQ